MREETVLVRARWTMRRVRRWWAHLLDDLVRAAAAQLQLQPHAIIAVEVEDPVEHSWSRRRYVMVRVRLYFLVLA